MAGLIAWVSFATIPSDASRFAVNPFRICSPASTKVLPMYLHRSVVLALLGLVAACHGTRDRAPNEIAGLALPACSAPVSASSRRSSGIWGITLRTEADIPAAIAAMTLAEKVGQMVQADVSTASPDDVRKYRLGSITDTVPKGDRQTTAAWRELYDGYQGAALQTRTGARFGPI